MFPEEIYFEIFLRLPVKSACVCKCVCKNWFSLISNPNFVKSHLNLTIQTNKSNLLLRGFDRSRDCEVMYSISHDSIPLLLSAYIQFLDYAVEMDYPFKSSLLYDSVELVGCCDGLVCLWFSSYSDFDKKFLCLWNPTTREYKKLPKSPNAAGYEYYNMIGFGYDCKSDDYKLVTRCFHSVVQVYSLELNSWTSMENVPYKFQNYRKVGLLVNGDLHWLAKAQDSSKVVVSLYFGDQNFKEIQLPNEARMNKDHWNMTLAVLEGCLAVHVKIAHIQSEIWVMQDYGVQESWTKRYIINHERIVTDYLPSLMWSFKSGELLFGPSFHRDLVIYDPKDESIRELNMPSLMQLYKEGCYYESLVSLGSGTYVGGKDCGSFSLTATLKGFFHLLLPSLF